MLRNKPKLKYNGLTLILSNPSRFDKVSLLTATGGQLFNDHCLRPEYNTMQCDIRLMEDKTPFLDDTKCVMLLGEAAMHHWCPTTKNNTLNEMRGSPLSINGIPAYASYFAQDAADLKSHEQNLNTDSKEYTGDESSTQAGDDEDGDVKRHSPTKRGNYAFWLRADTRKCKQVLKGNVRGVTTQPTYRIYPSGDDVIRILTNTKNQFLYFDIETDYEEQNLLCFAFSFDGITVYSVPVLDNTYSWAYSFLHFILRALCVAIRDNTIVAHNGAAFDFFVLANKYHIPVNKCYDTMLAMHRCFPDVEKSLGHCVSYWTDEPFHKDTDSRAYMTREHMTDKLKYCAKDVYTMALIHKSITAYAKTVLGLEQSIQCVMDSIRPYLITTLMGIKYSQEKVDKMMKENDSLMEQYMRCIRLLVGEIGMDACRKSIKGKAKSFPGSNTQCCNYFHEQLGYPVVMRSKKTEKPSLAKQAMFKLALKHDNPVIKFVLLYRQVAKESGTLKFNPWKNNDNQICKSSSENKVVGRPSLAGNQGITAFFAKHSH